MNEIYVSIINSYVLIPMLQTSSDKSKFEIASSDYN